MAEDGGAPLGYTERIVFLDGTAPREHGTALQVDALGPPSLHASEK